MIETFLLSFHLKLTYRKNSIIYAFQQFPFIGKYFSNHLYGNGGIEALISVISAFIEFISIFLGKFLYISLMVFLPASFYKGNEVSSFLIILFFLTIVGTWLNTNMFNPTKDKYYAIVLMRMNAKKEAISEYGYFLLKMIIGMYPFVFLFGFLSHVPWYLCLLAPWMVVGLKVISTAYNLNLYKKRELIVNENKPTPVIWIFIILFTVLAYIVPLCKIPGIEWIMLCCYLFVIILGIIMWKYIVDFDDYFTIYKKLLTPDHVILNAKNTQQDTLRKNALNAIDNKNLATSNKKGYDFFHELFIKRHRKILTTSAHNIALVAFVVTCIAGLVLVFVPDAKKPINSVMMNFLPYFLFIMYLLNRGSTITQAMFMNCDHSMLTYRFYRQPKTILELFRRRIVDIVKINLEPAFVIALALPFLLWLSGGTSESLNYIVLFVSIISMAIFFSVHHLVIYYLLQPYNINMEMKSPVYQVVNWSTYFICYYMMDLKMPTMVFGTVMIVFAVAYVLISLFLAYRYAPKTFHLK